jgi:hypothetical protein
MPREDRKDWHRPDEEVTPQSTSCPKCNLEFSTLLHPLCMHENCPVRALGMPDNMPRCPTGDNMTPDGAYEIIDHHLRATLDDQDYALYSEALETIYRK